jgi:iron complex outermembrane receptor protein
MNATTKSLAGLSKAVWIALSGGALVTPVASALAADEQPAGALEEVIVTAQKREQRLQDVPTTVNVLSEDSLRAAQVTEVNQLSTLTPGIFINSDQTGRNSKIKVRGVGPDEQSNIRPAVGFFYNDIPLMNQLQGGLSVASDLDLGDLERIEVLKGPQSTLFGESVSGGAIAFYNKRPSLDEDLNGRVAVSVGDHELQQVRGSFGAPLGDKFAFRVAAHHNEIEDQVLNTVDHSRRKLEGEGYSVQLLFEPTEYLSFILEYNYRRTSQDGGANDGMDAITYGQPTIDGAAANGITLTPADPFDRKVQMVLPFKEEMRNSLTSLHANWQINDQWSLTSITGYQENHDDFGGDDPLGGYNASNGPVVGFLAFGTQVIRYTTEELRLNYSGERLDSMFGVFYSDYQAPLSRGDFGFVFPGFIFPLAQYITVDKQTWSAFTHNSFKFTDEWEFVFGARYTSEKDDGYNQLIQGAGAYSGQPLDISGLPKSSSDEDAWGGTLKLLWHMSDEVTWYAGVDRGFRLGGINNLGQPNYDNEIALNYEIGVKGLLLDKTLRLNASVFHTKYDGYQVVSYNSDAFTFITQNADVTGEGVEVEAVWAPVRELELGASIAYNDTEYDKYLGATCDNYQIANNLCPNDPVPGSQNLSGRRLSAAPEWSGNATAQYTNDLGSTSLDWFVRAEYAYRGWTYSHPVGENGDPLQKIDSYGIVNASVGLRADQGWDITLWVKNLTDEDYLTNVSRQPVGSEPDWVTARIGWERSYGVSLSYNF